MQSTFSKCYTTYWPDRGSICPATLHVRLHVVSLYSRGRHTQCRTTLFRYVPLIVAGNTCTFRITTRIRCSLNVNYKWNIWSSLNGPKHTPACLMDDLLQWLTWVRVFRELINISRAEQEAFLVQMWPSGCRLVITGLVSFESLSLLQFNSDYNIQGVVKGIRAICVSL